MIRSIRVVFLIWIVSFNLHAQDKELKSDVNTLFAVKLDSIQQLITQYKKRIDTSFYLYYSIKNKSNKTLTYITNSCFYYNHYHLKMGGISYDLNPEGDCNFNALYRTRLFPTKTFSQIEWIHAYNLTYLEEGNLHVTLSIPLVKVNNYSYGVDGRSFMKNQELLVFEGETKIVHGYRDLRKGKWRKNRKKDCIYGKTE